MSHKCSLCILPVLPFARLPLSLEAASALSGGHYRTAKRRREGGHNDAETLLSNLGRSAAGDCRTMAVWHLSGCFVAGMVCCDHKNAHRQVLLTMADAPTRYPMAEPAPIT